jgi:hypothetical protein
MNGYQYILTKQTEWAKNRGITLIGSKGGRGQRSYTTHPDENLFQPLLRDIRESFDDGDGKELGSSDIPGKMQAVHSSSALGVNIFQYWKSISSAPVIAAACGLCGRGSQISNDNDIKFEEKYPINEGFRHHPNIDVVIHNNDPSAEIQRFAIECKFSEAYGGRKHGGLKPKYIACGDLWKDMPKLYRLAKSISPDDKDFKYLHPAQLIKHILGLKHKKLGFRLLYLWYDVLGEEGKGHRDEVARFASVAKSDGIKFHSLTYQELIAKLSRELRGEHGEYVRYLTERYL